MSGDPVIYLDRYTGTRQQEAIYGDGAVRFAYETLPGRALAWLLFSRPLLSLLFGWYMRRPASAARIRPFVEQYAIDDSEFALPVGAYRCFNDFFCRELKPGARPVDEDPGSVVFPADGRHFGWPALGRESQVYVKGQSWNLQALLGGDAELAARFAGGSLVLSRLCPVDYHHFHYPVAGKVLERRLLDGPLFSVSPVALRRNLGYLWRNRRYLIRMGVQRVPCKELPEQAEVREVGSGNVGATNVGSIHLNALREDGLVEKGAPAGCFEFGGSSVLTLFAHGQIRLAEDLVNTTGQGIELFARAGDRMGLLASQ